MKVIGLLSLIIVLFASLFSFAGANLTNNVAAVALMVLLISLFSDLKEFNFWGLKGKTKEEKQLKDLKGEEAITRKTQKKLPEEKVQTAMRQDTVVLMDNEEGNFLALAFDIERLLRVIAAILEGEEDTANIKPSRTLEILMEHGILTTSGQEQINAIRWLRNMLVHGRENELAGDTISHGVDLASDLHMELKSWLDNTTSTK